MINLEKSSMISTSSEPFTMETYSRSPSYVCNAASIWRSTVRCTWRSVIKSATTASRCKSWEKRSGTIARERKYQCRFCNRLCGRKSPREAHQWSIIASRSTNTSVLTVTSTRSTRAKYKYPRFHTVSTRTNSPEIRFTLATSSRNGSAIVRHSTPSGRCTLTRPRPAMRLVESNLSQIALFFVN